MSPLLKELDLTIGLLNNFAFNNDDIKASCVTLDLPDQLHKFFVWFSLDRNLLYNALRLISTLTSGCEEACQAMILTSPTLGAGPRRTPTGVSLLNATADVVSKEMSSVSKMRDLGVLKVALEILNNVCCIGECRNVLAKVKNILN